MVAVAESAPAYRQEWDRRVDRLVAQIFRPAATRSVSEWAEQERVLTKGEMAGQLWSNEEAPYLVEIMDLISAPDRPRRIAVKKSARVGYTEGVIGNSLGWAIAEEPHDVIVMQPSDEEADAYSIENVDPLLRQTPALREALHLDSYKDSRNKITYKAFPNGSLAIIGTKDSALRRRSARTAFSDEIDELKVEYKQGDPLGRLSKRLDDFDDALHVSGSTPTTLGASRIDALWKQSDQRRWHVPCPHCELEQPIEWGGKESPHGVKWVKEVYCRTCGSESEPGTECSSCGSPDLDIRHVPETVHYVCKAGCRIEEVDKRAMVQAGRWIATNPAGRFPGFHIHALMSLFSGARWEKLVGEWIEAIGDPEALKVFVNTVLGEVFDPRGKQKVKISDLEDRAEVYVGPDGSRVVVPDGVGVLAAGVDVQKDRLELLIKGFGANKVTWDIVHERVYGSPDDVTTWGRLDFLLARAYRHASGADLYVLATMIDSGYKTDMVYDFVRPREARNVWASKGDRGERGAPPLKRPTRANDSKVKVFTIGTFTLKDTLFTRLAIQVPGPGYMHLRKQDPSICNGFDGEFFRQFGGERKNRTRVKGSIEWREQYVKTRANEAIDLNVGALAAFRALGPAVYDNMPTWVAAARAGQSVVPRARRRRRRTVSKGVEV